MKRAFLLGGISGIAGMGIFLAIISIPVDSQIPDGGIPPTDAWSKIIIVNNVTWPNQTQDDINATKFNDDLYLLTDGSILLNITSYP